MVIHPKSMVTSLPALDLPNPLERLNPLNWLADAIRDARDLTIAMIEAGIANPPRISDDLAIQHLYQVTLNPASYWAWVVVVFSLVVSLLTFKAHGRILHAIVVMLVIIALSPSYVYLMNEMARLGDDLSTAVSGIYTSAMSDNLDSIGNPWLDLLSFGYVVIAAAFTLGIFWSADPAYMVMVFLLPLAFAVSAMGPRTRNVFNAFASIAIVLALVGRPVAILVLEVFQVAVDVQPGPNAVFAENLVTAMAFNVATIMQLTLMIVCYVGIKQVQGAIASQITRMQSQVKTSVMNAVRIRPDSSSAPRFSRPVPVVITNNGNSGIRTAAKREASNAIVNVGIAGAAAAAGAATGNPKVAKAVNTGGKTATRIARDNRKGKR